MVMDGGRGEAWAATPSRCDRVRLAEVKALAGGSVSLPVLRMTAGRLGCAPRLLCPALRFASPPDPLQTL
jgi:hypothetical protein